MAPVLEQLKGKGIIRAVEEGGEETVLPGGPGEEVRVWEVAEALMGRDALPTAGGLWAEKCFQAMKNRLDAVPIRGIVNGEDPEDGER